MPILTATTDDFRKLAAKLEGIANNVPQEIAIAGKEAGYKGRRLVAKQLAKHIKLPQKRLLKTCYVKSDRNGATLTIRGNFRIALNRFKSTRTARGIEVAVGPGRSTQFHSAFNTTRKRAGKNKKVRLKKGKSVTIKSGVFKRAPITKLRGQIIKRDGASRLPISAVPAVRPTQVLQETRAIERIWVDMRLLFFKTLQRRVRFLTRKKAGNLNWQQKGN
jgi:transcription antitermination factor NusG